MFNLTQEEKEKLNTVAELEKYSLKELVEILESSLDNKEDVKKVGMKLTNDAYEMEELEQMGERAETIIEKYNNQYPTDKDLE